MSPTNHKDPTVSVKMSSGWYWRCAARMFECYGLLLIYFLGNKFRRLVWKVAYSNARNSLVSSLILKDKVSFEQYFQFPVECRKPHSSKSIRLEMAGDRVKPSEFETRKKSYLELSLADHHSGVPWESLPIDAKTHGRGYCSPRRPHKILRSIFNQYLYFSGY